MKTKLTLTIEESILAEAKQYSSKMKKSLSGLIEEYLQHVSQKNKKKSIVDSTKGILKRKYTGRTDREIKDSIFKEKYHV